MKPEVERALNELRSAYPENVIEVEEDSEGGVYVKVLRLEIGSQYEPECSWIAFRITFQYPFADTYPHFLVPNLKRKDGKPLGSEFQSNNQFWQTARHSEPATMISRRSNRRDPATETAAIKLSKVLNWIRSR